METNKQKFARVYAESFKEAYPDLPVERTEHLIEKAIEAAIKNIRHVEISGKAFQLTFKKLGIEKSYNAYTYKAIEQFLNG